MPDKKINYLQNKQLNNLHIKEGHEINYNLTRK